MSKFIMLQPTAGTRFLLRVDSIHSVEMSTGKASRVITSDAGGNVDSYTVAHTIDEIHAMIEKAEAKEST
jgi:hypothetical protein